jgi:hypothetical protein
VERIAHGPDVIDADGGKIALGIGRIGRAPQNEEIGVRERCDLCRHARFGFVGGARQHRTRQFEGKCRLADAARTVKQDSAWQSSTFQRAH